MIPPVEVTTRYATTVDDLASAWTFVMERVDAVGPDPKVTINPIRIISVAEMQDGLDGLNPPAAVRQFEVVVEGIVEEAGA